MTIELLDETSVVAHLRGRGVLGAGPVTVTALGGGVSNVVLAVADGHRRLVVKQALPRLRVAAEWTAPTDRTLTEADALVLTAGLTPGAVPAVIDRDDERHVLVLEHAPDGWRDWKADLLAGVVDASTAARLGEVLARWHTATTDPATLPGRIRDGGDAFERLRVEPFYRRVAAQLPGELGEAILATADAMTQHPACLVHGDFSPKNVLVGQGLWVIDFEVAHRGDPAFDLAFLLCHLALKAVHRPASAAGYARCATAFATAYGAKGTIDWPYVLRHTGCLVLARVRGASPAEYLTAAGRDTAWRLGVDLLTGAVRSLDDLFPEGR
ncbi:phosphotransferase [Jiangella anatolica]|uniref:Phosphotransferase n=1 Tax=Jiangella anatolica TaxID=2670374 RepID=A0A2W2BFC8_9ACTN|nr:aminoglycoside phosphotransferase family protein [Jiangella anatolica]PZF85875.1 phosphotransferase [Jiangella anatolica]